MRQTIPQPIHNRIRNRIQRVIRQIQLLDIIAVEIPVKLQEWLISVF